MVSPLRSSAIQLASATRTPRSCRSRRTRCRARARPASGQGRRPYGASNTRTSPRLSSAEMSLAQVSPKTLPGQGVDAARTEQRPQRHLDRAGCRRAGRDRRCDSRRGCRAGRASARSPPRAWPLPAGERCERPRRASARPYNDQPGHPAQGPGRRSSRWPAGPLVFRCPSPHRWRSLEVRDKRSNVTASVRKNPQVAGRTSTAALKALPAFEEAARHLELQRRRARLNLPRRHQPADEVARDASRGPPVPSPQPACRVDRRRRGVPAGDAHRARCRRRRVRRDCRRRTRRGPLVISCLPTFMMRWLIPRLYDFNARHPRDRRAALGIVGAGRLRARGRRCRDPHQRRAVADGIRRMPS